MVDALRILMLSEYYAPHWTGLSKAFVQTAEHLAQKNDVTVLTTRYDARLDSKELRKSVRILRVPYSFRVSRTHYSLQTITTFAKIVSEYDLVVINSPYSNILFCSLIARLKGIPIVVFHQGDLILPTHQRTPVKNFIIERIFDVFTVLSMWMATGVSTYTRDYAVNSRVMRHFLKKFTPYVPPFDIRSAVSSPKLDGRLTKLRGSHRLVGFAGRFVEEKGFDILLRAMPLVAEQMPGVKFVFAGEINVVYENFFSKVKDLVVAQSERIEVLGLLDQGDLIAFYKSLDVFVLSSRSDCFALTQVEAALFGVPLVVTNIPGARVLATETRCGLVAEAEDPNSLAERIIEVLRYPARFTQGLTQVDSFLARYRDFPLVPMSSEDSTFQQTG